MPAKKPLAIRWAVRVRSLVMRADPRALVAGTALAGVAAWFAPWQALPFFFLPACLIGVTAYRLMPQGARLIRVYAFFALLWTVSRLGLYLVEHPGAFADSLEGALMLGARLCTMLGLALAIPLALTPLLVGRVLCWYLSGFAALETRILDLPPLRGRIRPRLAELAWRASLGMVLMMSFFPRALRLLSDLRRSLYLRAPGLPLSRRLALLGMGALRVLSLQTWDMTLSIASRDLYRPEPWNFRGMDYRNSLSASPRNRA